MFFFFLHAHHVINNIVSEIVYIKRKPMLLQLLHLFHVLNFQLSFAFDSMHVH